MHGRIRPVLLLTALALVVPLLAEVRTAVAAATDYFTIQIGHVGSVRWITGAYAAVDGPPTSVTLELTTSAGTMSVTDDLPQVNSTLGNFSFDLGDLPPVPASGPVTVVFDPSDARRYVFTLPDLDAELAEPGIIAGRAAAGDTVRGSLSSYPGAGSTGAQRTVTAGQDGFFRLDFTTASPVPPDAGTYPLATWVTGVWADASISRTSGAGRLEVDFYRTLPSVSVTTRGGDQTDTHVSLGTTDRGTVFAIGDHAWLPANDGDAWHVDLTAPGGDVLTHRGFAWDLGPVPVRITGVDRSTRTVSGLAPAGSEVSISYRDGTGQDLATETATGGSWSHSFGGSSGRTEVWAVVQGDDGVYRSDEVRLGPLATTGWTAVTELSQDLLTVTGLLLDPQTPFELEATDDAGTHRLATETIDWDPEPVIRVHGADFVPPLDLADGPTLTVSGAMGAVTIDLPRLEGVTISPTTGSSAVYATTDPGAQVEFRLEPAGIGNVISATETADAEGNVSHTFGRTIGPGDVVQAGLVNGSHDGFAADAVTRPARYSVTHVVPIGTALLATGRTPGLAAFVHPADVSVSIGLGYRYAGSLAGPLPTGTTARPIGVAWDLSIAEDGQYVSVPDSEIDLFVSTGIEHGFDAPTTRFPGDPYVGFDAGHGWETVPSSKVTWCLEPTSVDHDAICRDYPMPFAHVAGVGHASSFALFDGNPAGPLDVDRAAGPTRIETAIALSSGSFDHADAVVVATAAAFPDALAAAPLAAAADAPVLLTGPDELDPGAAAEIDRLGASTVYLMGGTAALSDTVEQELANRPAVTAIARVAGSDRFATAAAAASRATTLWRTGGDPKAGRHVLVALGTHADPNRAWPDALAAGQLAAQAHQPILLTAPDRVPDMTQLAIAELGATHVTVVGGTAAITEATSQQLGSATTVRDRIGGATRYDTARLLAERAVRYGATDRDVIVATGGNWPDGLAAAPATARRGGVLLLVDRESLLDTPEAHGWLEERKAVTRWVRIAGGTAAIRDLVQDQITTVLAD